jgi:hypothetical protein
MKRKIIIFYQPASALTAVLSMRLLWVIFCNRLRWGQRPSAWLVLMMRCCTCTLNPPTRRMRGMNCLQGDKMP